MVPLLEWAVLVNAVFGCEWRQQKEPADHQQNSRAAHAAGYIARIATAARKYNKAIRMNGVITDTRFRFQLNCSDEDVAKCFGLQIVRLLLDSSFSEFSDSSVAKREADGRGNAAVTVKTREA